MPRPQMTQVWNLREATDPRGVVTRYWEHEVRNYGHTPTGRNVAREPVQRVRCMPGDVPLLLASMMEKPPEKRQKIVFVPWVG